MIAHGTNAGWEKGCRCERCTRARSRHLYRARTGAKSHGARDVYRPHGTRARYVKDRCRCERCRAANREYARQRYQERAQLHANLARGDDLYVLDRSLVQRGKTLEQSPGREAAARLDEIIRLRTQIDRIQRARATVRTA